MLTRRRTHAGCRFAESFDNKTVSISSGHVVYRDNITSHKLLRDQRGYSENFPECNSGGHDKKITRLSTVVPNAFTKYISSPAGET